MKNLIISARRCTNRSVIMNVGFIHKTVLFFYTTILTGLLITSCQKQDFNEAKSINPISDSNTEKIATANNGNNKDEEVIKMYSGLSKETIHQLQQARAATARYRDIKNAIKEGYTNINVDVPNMGHHFMKSSLVDATFDIRKPEILVYNGIETGNPELVAVEYAVPIDQPMPEGFSGSSDVWNGNAGFPLWLVHAWVWKFNPEGVFNWTNPTVELD